MLELPPLGLYVHTPWCARKCPYCDFNSHERPGGGIPEAEYVERLLADLERELAREQRTVDSSGPAGTAAGSAGGSACASNPGSSSLTSRESGRCHFGTSLSRSASTTRAGTAAGSAGGSACALNPGSSSLTSRESGRRHFGTSLSRSASTTRTGAPARGPSHFGTPDGTTVRRIETVFFGGGTPSLFQPESFARLLDKLRAGGRLAPDAEITLEANPGTAEAARFAGYRKAGINRLSVGAQSFSDAALARLGRIHGSREAREAIAMARAAGFDNINIDLMFGLPGQSREAALRDLETAIELRPEHISWYQLTLEPNTVFWRRPPPLPAEDDLYAMQRAGVKLLAEAGYARYEVSAFALDDKHCRHNANYWAFGDYLGIGAGAHGKLTEPEANRILRTRKTRQPNHYLAPGEPTIVEEVPEAERPLEFLMNALRRPRGFRVGDFERRTGIAFETIQQKIECLAKRKLLQSNGDFVRATALGYRFLDSILGEFP